MAKISKVKFPEAVEIPRRWADFTSRFRRIYTGIVLFQRATKEDIEDLERRIEQLENP